MKSRKTNVKKLATKSLNKKPESVFDSDSSIANPGKPLIETEHGGTVTGWSHDGPTKVWLRATILIGVAALFAFGAVVGILYDIYRGDPDANKNFMENIIPVGTLAIGWLFGDKSKKG